MVRAGPRHELQRERLGHRAHHGMVRVAQRRRAAHHVALDVAAGGDGGEQRLIDAGDGGLELALDHAVELEALAGRDPQRAVAVRVGDPLEREVLLAGDLAGRMATRTMKR